MVQLSDPTRPEIGALVRVRGRDWVVLPGHEPDVLRLRPLTGGDDDAAIGVFLPLEGRDIQPSAFDPPDPANAGDATGGLLLLDASRLSLRSGATPFRCLGRLSVAPRPYQFVPLMLALRQDPVRLLIADDVGTGKTIEAGIIAREILDRGLARRLAVVCPAHLCDQWEAELREKFSIEAAVIQPSRIGRLERDLPRQDISIYQYYRHLIVSIDFIKSERNRGAFLQHAPDLVIVDEAHTAARPRGGVDRVQHQLPWNPNRLEQREGRVDRFGQPKPTVRTALLYGRDNPVDLVVLEVLVRKARTIRSQLGVSVPVPIDSERVLETLVDNVLLRGDQRGGVQLGFAFETPEISRLHAAWDQAAEREERQRSYFAQRGIQPDEVARELAATDPVLGDSAAVERFLTNAAQRFRGSLTVSRSGGLELHPGELRSRLVARRIDSAPLRVTFDRRTDPQAEYVGRMHPVVATFCDAVIGAALAPEADERFARCGAMYTNAVQIRTCLVLLRARYLLNEQDATEQLGEEVALAAFERRGGQLTWLEPLDSIGRELLSRARPAANMSPNERADHVRWALDFLQAQPGWYTGITSHRVQELQASHSRLRKILRAPRLRIEPRTPPDILGCYVLVPAGTGH